MREKKHTNSKNSDLQSERKKKKLKKASHHPASAVNSSANLPRYQHPRPASQLQLAKERRAQQVLQRHAAATQAAQCVQQLGRTVAAAAFAGAHSWRVFLMLVTVTAMVVMCLMTTTIENTLVLVHMLLILVLLMPRLVLLLADKVCKPSQLVPRILQRPCRP